MALVAARFFRRVAAVQSTARVATCCLARNSIWQQRAFASSSAVRCSLCGLDVHAFDGREHHGLRWILHSRSMCFGDAITQGPSLAECDPELNDIIEKERTRQWKCLELIASEVGDHISII